MCRAPTSSRCFPGVDRLFSSRYHASYCARSLFFFSSLHPPLVRLITLLCASEAQSFRSNRERMDTSTSSVCISPFTETHLSPALSSHTAARHGRGGGQNKPEHQKKKARRQLLISTLCVLRASRGRRVPVSPGARVEARLRRWRQADEKTPRG